jgi:hypothetical protein
MRRVVVKESYGSCRAIMGGVDVVLRASCVVCWFPPKVRIGLWSLRFSLC